MVTDDRGQLILIGAIAIALILVGLVLVVNTALFTEVVGSEGTVETAKEGGVATQELEDAVSAVAHNATLDETSGSTNYVPVSDTVEDELQPVLGNASADSKGAFVSVEYVGSTSTGTHAHQDATEPYQNSAGTSYEFVPATAPADVGHFMLVVDQASTGGPVDVTVEGDGGTSRTLTIDADSDPVSLSGASASSACSGFDATDDTVRIDLVDGRVYEEPECTFDLFGPLDAPYAVDSSGGGSAEGTFSLVTDRSDLQSAVSYSGVGDNVEFDDAIWSYEFAYEYDTDEVTVEAEREVDVYD